MAEGRTIFRDAHLIDGESPPRGGMSVVVEGNRIAQVQPGAIEAGERDRVIELDGKSLMPAMVQGHFHTGFGPAPNLGQAPILGLEAPGPYLGMVAAKNAQIALQCGVTGIIGSSNGDLLDVCLREAMVLGVVEGPRMLACTREFMVPGDMADGTNRSWFMGIQQTGLTRRLSGAEEFRAAAREEIGRGCDVVKVSASQGHGSAPVRDTAYLTDDELRAVVEVAHQHGKLVRAHCASRPAIVQCARLGVDIIDHADRIDAEGMEAVAKAGATICPSLLWSVRFLQFAESWDYNMGPFPIGEGFPETRAMTDARLRGVREDFEYTCEMLPEVARAGINLVVGDDYGFGLMPHGDYVSELEVYTKQLGIPASDVVRWASSNGWKTMAPVLGLEGEIGTVAAGQLADLLVVDGDPSADISCLRDRVAVIMKDGAFVRDGLA